MKKPQRLRVLQTGTQPDAGKAARFFQKLIDGYELMAEMGFSIISKHDGSMRQQLPSSIKWFRRF